MGLVEVDLGSAKFEGPEVWMRPAGLAAQNSSGDAVLVMRPDGRAAEINSGDAVSERRPCGRGVGSLGGPGSDSFESLFVPCGSHVARSDRVNVTLHANFGAHTTCM